MQTLRVLLKFSDQRKKRNTNGFPSIEIQVNSQSLSLEEICRCICDHAQFIKERRDREIRSGSFDFRVFCGGRELSNANLTWLANTPDPVVAKITTIQSQPPPPSQHRSLPPHRSSGFDGSDLPAFREFLRDVNSAFLNEFFQGNAVCSSIQDTQLYRIASKAESLRFPPTPSGEAVVTVDCIEHCIEQLKSLHVNREECVERRKILNHEELDFQKYCLEVGKVRPLSLHSRHGDLFSAPPYLSDTAAPSVERNKTPWKKSTFTYSQRLHHKLHDMLMFNIAELELDGKPYSGEVQKPKRDPKVPDRAPPPAKDPLPVQPFLNLFKKAAKGKISISCEEVSEIVKREFERIAPQEFVAEALSECGLHGVSGGSSAFDEAMFKDLVEKILENQKQMEQRTLTSFVSSLNHMLLQSKFFGCPKLEKDLQIALETTQTQLLQPHPAAAAASPPEHWFEKDSPWVNLEDIMYCWRKSSKRKKVMPLPLSALCKHLFGTALKKGARTITLKEAADIVMQEFARALDRAELVAEVWDVDADADVDEAGFLVRVQGACVKNDKSSSVKKDKSSSSAAHFTQVFAAALESGSNTLKLRRVREILLEEYASEVNGTELVALLKLAKIDPDARVNDAKFFELVQKLQPKVGVRDVVEFYDKLVQIEEERKLASKPPKLEFQISSQSQRSMDMHRILDNIQREAIVTEGIRNPSGNFFEHKLCFEGQIFVRCASMKPDSDFRASYLKSISDINTFQGVNEDQMKEITSNIKVLSSFLFILARAKMHNQQGCNPEVEATSSFGLTGIKQFKNFISDSIYEAESKAYDDLLGIYSDDVMRADPQIMRHLRGGGQCKLRNADRYGIRVRFRQLCFAAIKELYNEKKKDQEVADYAKFIREPFMRLKKPRTSNVGPLEIPKPAITDTFTVATVTRLLAFYFLRSLAHTSAVQHPLSRNGHVAIFEWRRFEARVANQIFLRAGSSVQGKNSSSAQPTHIILYVVGIKAACDSENDS
jgi:hypothetical protein